MENCSTLLDTSRLSQNNEPINSLISNTNFSYANAKSETHSIIPRDFIGARSVAQIIENELLTQKGEEPFFVADMGEVIRQHLKWRKLLPRIEPFYGKLGF